MMSLNLFIMKNITKEKGMKIKEVNKIDTEVVLYLSFKELQFICYLIEKEKRNGEVYPPELEKN